MCKLRIAETKNGLSRDRLKAKNLSLQGKKTSNKCILLPLPSILPRNSQRTSRFNDDIQISAPAMSFCKFKETLFQ